MHIFIFNLGVYIEPFLYGKNLILNKSICGQRQLIFRAGFSFILMGVWEYPPGIEDQKKNKKRLVADFNLEKEKEIMFYFSYNSLEVVFVLLKI